MVHSGWQISPSELQRTVFLNKERGFDFANSYGLKNQLRLPGNTIFSGFDWCNRQNSMWCLRKAAQNKAAEANTLMTEVDRLTFRADADRLTFRAVNRSKPGCWGLIGLFQTTSMLTSGLGAIFWAFVALEDHLFFVWSYMKILNFRQRHLNSFNLVKGNMLSFWNMQFSAEVDKCVKNTKVWLIWNDNDVF